MREVKIDDRGILVGTARGSLVSISSCDASLDSWTMWGGDPRHIVPERG